jgi:hypothetical protein
MRKVPKEAAHVMELARHLFISPQRVREMEAERIIARINGKFDLDDSRRRVLEHLRERRRPRADDAWREARAEELRQRTAIRARELIEFSEAQAAVEECMGVVLVELGSFPARVGKRDLKLRRELDQEVFDPGSRTALRGQGEGTQGPGKRR